jgi:hypothetical protein
MESRAALTRYRRRNLAAADLRAAEENVVAARVKLEECEAEIDAAQRKKRLGDAPRDTVKHQRVLQARERVDQRLLALSTAPENAWLPIVRGDGTPFLVYCHRDGCMQNGSYACMYDLGVQICTLCYDRASADELVAMANVHRPPEPADPVAIIAKESCGDGETADLALARANDLDCYDHWRCVSTGVDPWRCLACDDVAPPEKPRHYLVGHVSVVLCAKHHKERTISPRIRRALGAAVEAATRSKLSVKP